VRKILKNTTAKRLDFTKPETLLKTQNLILKTQTPIEDESQFWEMLLGFTEGACQRFALLACGWDADSLERQEKLGGRKMLENSYSTHPSSARFVGRTFRQAQ